MIRSLCEIERKKFEERISFAKNEDNFLFAITELALFMEKDMYFVPVFLIFVSEIT